MPQLIGLECAVCNERITSVLDGEFCTTCGNPIHKHCSTPNVGRSGACRACGAEASAGAAYRRASREETRHHARRSLRYHTLTGLLSLGVGLALLAFGLVPFLLAAADGGGAYVLWIGGVFAGAALTVRGLAHIRVLWRMRSGREREETNIYAVDSGDREP